REAVQGVRHGKDLGAGERLLPRGLRCARGRSRLLLQLCEGLLDEARELLGRGLRVQDLRRRAPSLAGRRAERRGARCPQRDLVPAAPCPLARGAAPEAPHPDPASVRHLVLATPVGVMALAAVFVATNPQPANRCKLLLDGPPTKL